MLLVDPDLYIEGTHANVLTPVYVVTAQALEDSGIDPHTADELARIITTRVEARWQAIGLVVRHTDGPH